jgi:hypothetical protein
MTGAEALADMVAARAGKAANAKTANAARVRRLLRLGSGIMVYPELMEAEVMLYANR